MLRETPRYLEATLLPAQVDDVLELDELWSFVGSKACQCWIWVALCRRTRQIVAWTPGDRSAETCLVLWNKIPASYKQGLCYTDFWEAYKKVIPDDQHRPSAKKEGQTNHHPFHGYPNGSTSPYAKELGVLSEKHSPFLNTCSGITGTFAPSSSFTTGNELKSIKIGNSPVEEPPPLYYLSVSGTIFWLAFYF